MTQYKEVVLAMDLSMNCPAFAVVAWDGRHLDVLHKSHIKTNTKKSHGYRLCEIYRHLGSILMEWQGRLTAVVSEKGFSRFANVTQILFMVHGVAKLAIHSAGEEVVEMSPTTVKKLVTGSGKASKEVVADSLLGYFPIKLEFATDDESDAVAVALAYLLKKGVIRQ
ncbi:crossover junction endodeoxyribonuclease RuvC [Bacillus nitratireducens]|uniref:crossover junction endodeoxyribonuclease RuvC n=1 Tax=Bacillus nitratireducens TaxID=2026193 RepID=UPI00119D2FDA|nr:crossover junction endodeoxyribonuclease RuvC [Bacillus nitratireducens]